MHWFDPYRHSDIGCSTSDSAQSSDGQFICFGFLVSSLGTRDTYATHGLKRGEPTEIVANGCGAAGRVIGPFAENARDTWSAGQNRRYCRVAEDRS
jgi:hypothetical protein